MEAFEVPLREWIAQGRTRRAIKKRFRLFLTEYQKQRGSPLVYIPKIKAMCADNKSSLEVSYVHICNRIPIIAIWLADVPRDMLQIFDEVLKEGKYIQ